MLSLLLSHISLWFSPLQPFLQEYERISERRYRYSSDAGKLVAEIVVDEECLVLNYEGLWQREGDL
jgi:hypothetical protein